MVKSILSVSHQGLRDWIVQRVSAVYMAIYVIGLVIFLMMTPGLSFPDWHALFSNFLVKVATAVFALSLLTHAWVGIWTIVTDYVTCPILRCVFHTVVFLALTAFFFAVLLILWSV